MIMGALLDKHADNVGQAYSIFFLFLQGLCVVGAIAWHTVACETV